MPSKLFDAIGHYSGSPQAEPPMNDINSITKKFEDFSRQYQGSNPREIVNNMVANGQMTKEQFNKFGKMANQLRPFIK